MIFDGPLVDFLLFVNVENSSIYHLSAPIGTVLDDEIIKPHAW